jgi:hypothetical protein
VLTIHSDPWWIFTTVNLFWNIVRRYEFGIIELIRVSPRFAVLLASMSLSVGFIIVDILSVTEVFKSSLPEGINPFWKLAFIFKCFTDTIILDDFKTALDKLKQYKLERLGTGTMHSDELASPNVAHFRRGTDYQPYNESRGVTAQDKPRRETTEFANIDLEIAYWNTEHEEGPKASNSTG